MITDKQRPGLPARRYHLWPHGTRVLDLGDDVHAAVHVRDFATHDYVLRGVRLRGAGPVDVVAYYDGQHQSGLTQEQRDLVRAWVRRYAAPARGAPAPADAPFWTSYVAQSVAPDIAPAPASDATDRRPPAARTVWLALALLPAALALALVGYGVARAGPSADGGGSLFVSAAAVLALVSAVITWRHRAGSGFRGAVARDAARTSGVQHQRQAGRPVTGSP